MSARRGGRTATAATVADLLATLDTIAPFELAAEWDNVGLLLGRSEWPARDGLLAIDLTDAVANEALDRGVDTVIVYHPPIFKGTKVVTPDAPGPTSRLPDLLTKRISVIALHTALDAAAGGTNDVLLDLLAVTERHPLEPVVRADRQQKLVVFVPRDHVDRLRGALSAAGAGVIGHYNECSFELAGQGTFKGDETTNPAVGRRSVLERVDEIRLEMVVPRDRLGAAIAALYANHPYEEPAFDIYLRHEAAGRGAVGLGRVGVLRRPTRGAKLLEYLQRAVDLRGAQLTGTLKREFASVTAAAGSFGVHAFRDPDSLVLTGEFKHHDALELVRRGVTAIALGHWASERPVLPVVKKRVAAALPAISLRIARADTPPLRSMGTRP
jgi:dinuclear metal center YbgI/SA1388 family protein